MPELPEVETIATRLRIGGQNGCTSPSLVGKRIRNAQVLWHRTLADPSPVEFNQRIIGQIIQDIGRRGKHLLFSLSREFLLVHLRMSGDLVIETDEAVPASHHRLILDMDNGLRLSLNDPRKFARAWLTATPDSLLGHLGPEPLGGEFTPEIFYQGLKDRHRQLKPLLLDQSFLAGLGNIYTDEALHLAKLHPLRISDTLSYHEAQRLWTSIRQVLGEGIRRSGASIDWVYRGGDFQNYFRAYHRSGEPCPECGVPIHRIIVGQRGTHICPHCQRLEE